METTLKKNNFFGLSKEQTRLAVKGFIACFAILVVFQFNIGQTKFYNDANWYFSLSKSFFGDNFSFSFLNFPRTLRGYFFPFMLSPIRGLYLLFNETINELYLYRIYLSFLHGLTFGVLIPATYENTFGKNVSIFKRVILLLIMLYFWQGFFIHPLTEIPMIITLIISMYFFSLMISENNFTKIIFYGLFVGIFIYGAYNTRTINLVFIILLPIIFLMYGKNRPFKSNLIGAFSIIIGIVISAYPQTIINQNNYQKSSPLVIADDIPNGLFVPQLYRGLNTIRYQPYLGEEDFPNGLLFYHETGSVIWNSVKGEISFKTYLILVSQYPLDFVGIYFNHFLAALDLRWNSDYVYDVKNIDNFFALINFTFWFFAIFFHKEVFTFSKNLLSKKYMFLLFFIPPSIASLPAPTESRYYISMYVCLYYFLVYNTKWNEIYAKIRTNIGKHIGQYAVYIVFMFSLSGSILGRLNENPIFLSGPSDYSIYFEIILDKFIK